jgi:hypothetical protein
LNAGAIYEDMDLFARHNFERPIEEPFYLLEVVQIALNDLDGAFVLY